MEPVQPSPYTQSATSLIQDWQATALVEPESKDSGIIARLAHGCIDFLALLLQALSQSRTIPRKSENALRRSHATLKLWAEGHGVSEGRLDDILDRSRSLKFTTLTALNALCKVLIARLSKVVFAHSEAARLLTLRTTNTQVLYEQTRWLLSGNDENSSDSETDSSSDEEEYDEVDAIVNDLKTYVQCLVDLSNSLECPAMDPDHEDDEASLPRLQIRAAHDFYADIITRKYPQANIEVVEHLGKANWERYQRLQAERRLNVARGDTEEYASRSILADSEFKDSGLGTSVPAQSSYAQSVISILSTVSSGAQLQIPPLPASAKSGLPFECLACGKNVKVQTNREWRRHLFKDLQPYSCFQPSCNFSIAPFRERQLWIAHLELQHGFGPSWNNTQCSLCFEHTGSGKNVILRHFARHMEDIALAALPRGVDSGANSEIDSDEDLGSNDTGSPDATAELRLSTHSSLPKVLHHSPLPLSDTPSTAMDNNAPVTIFNTDDDPKVAEPTQPETRPSDHERLNNISMKIEMVQPDQTLSPGMAELRDFEEFDPVSLILDPPAQGLNSHTASNEDIITISGVPGWQNLEGLQYEKTLAQLDGDIDRQQHIQKFMVATQGGSKTGLINESENHSLRCPRCYDEMASRRDLDDHLRRYPGCKIRSGPESNGRRTETDPESTQMLRYFLSGDGIERAVITADLQRYLGPDAMITQGQAVVEQQATPGYWIDSYRSLTPAMIDNLKLDSQRWAQERDKRDGTKRCHSCNRADTPEWRRGPDGPKTLCNACGLHYAKMLRKMSGI
ncbi:hypothetical protein BDV96DRAFT_645109 [Lophiotrema nucula]|uniref:GATA-type domain-containing protein n=1 Tax=Lophiotrema nucula TaxID=690887 RepID=A0A6A5ZD75_9PLEO|nr:hypothetical protein BDV96DRAFT_645109 [Lophiotrema nucula]